MQAELLYAGPLHAKLVVDARLPEVRPLWLSGGIAERKARG